MSQMKKRIKTRGVMRKYTFVHHLNKGFVLPRKTVQISILCAHSSDAQPRLML